MTKAAEGRHRTPDEIEAVAQGRVWTGEEALHAGLVDALGGLDTALALARDKAHLAQGQDLNLVVLPEHKGFFELLVERQDDDIALRVPGLRAVALLRWAAALGGSGPIARLPFELAVR